MGKYRKQIVIGLLIVFVVTASLPVLLRPQSAQAFLGLGDLSITIGNIPGMIWRAIDKGLKVATDVTFKNMLNQYVNNLAYNYAVKLATGESGQKPLFFDLSTVIQSAADQAVGEFANELLLSTSGGGTCQYASGADGLPISCVADSQCPMIAVADPQKAQEFRDNAKSGGPQLVSPYRFIGNYSYIVIDNEAQWQGAQEDGWAVDGSLRRDKCQVANDASFAGIDICRISSPGAEIIIKNIALQVQTPPKPRCTFSELKQNFEDLRQIDTGGLIRVSEQFNARSNEIGVIQNLVTTSLERRSFAIAQQGLEVEVGNGLRGVENTVTDKTKTPSTYVEEATKESFFRAPLRSLTTRTGSIVADALGTFANTFASKMLQKVFNDGFTPDAPGSSIRFSSNGSTLTGVAAARLKFADLQKLTDIKLRERDPSALLQQLTNGCNLESTQSIGVSTIRVDALRETNNCIIDESFRLAVEQGLTVGQAINYRDDSNTQRLIDPNRDFGVHADGSGVGALAGLGCEGCDPEIYSLRSIMVLRKYGIVPVGWELAARYISEVLQPSGVAQTYSLGELVENYSNPESPFYRLVDPDWQLKAPPSVKEIRGPGERIIASFPVRDQDTNGDAAINELDEVSQIIQRGAEASDEQTCIYENEDGTCAYWGYCTEQDPFWRIAGDTCKDYFNTCQVFTRGGDEARVTYRANTTDGSVCNADVAGCRQFSVARDAVTGNWLDTGAGNTVFADRGAARCDASAAGCSEFLSLSDLRGNPLPAFSSGGSGSSVESVIAQVASVSGTIDTYANYAFAQKLFLNNQRIDCRNTIDYDGNGVIEEDANVSCRLYTPLSYSGPDLPATYTPASIDSSGTITSYNDECPAECVGFQPYEEAAAIPLYPYSAFIDLIASTAQSCSAAAVGCTEFTNLNNVSQGGEGRQFYTQLRECVAENDSSLQTYFTWEGSDDTGFQLRSWRLVSNGSGPIHSGDTDYNLCNQAIFNLPPEDPEANPDCREYIDTSLNEYYRLASRVVVGTGECQPLRRTLTDINYDGAINDADCTAGGGEVQGGECIYYALPSESKTCNQSSVGCRQYQGFGSGNNQIILNNTFEAGNLDGWTRPGGGTSSMSNTNNSVVLGGHSLGVDGSGEISHVINGLDRSNYVLNFWAAGTASLSARIEDDGGNSASFAASASLVSGWQGYIIGPATINFDPVGEVRLVITGWSGSNWIDNIILTKSNDLYMISNSWNVPTICTTPESQLYCAAYRDDQGEQKFIKNFARLCAEEFVGCEAMVETHNSDSALGGSYAGVSTPADSIAYLVNNPNHYCKEADAGCSELGLRTVKRDGEVSFSSQYRILDPDFYSISLCSAEAELCEEYFPSGGFGGFPKYFKDPQDRVCEYRTNVIVPPFNQVQSGWFKVGADPITAEDVCQLGDIPSNETNAPVCNYDYVGQAFENPTDIAVDFNNARYVAPGVGCYSYQCPAAASSCTEYQDPSNPDGCDRELLANEGRCVGSSTICTSSSDCGGAQCDKSNACDYYYFLRDTLDSGIGECQGEIDAGLGCVGFYETDRGEDSKYLRAECQAGCALIKRCYNAGSGAFSDTACASDLDCGVGGECRGAPVREYPNCNLDLNFDDPNSKPGCVF